MEQDVHIIINGIPLSIGAVMTIHVALNDFAVDLRENGLGDDHYGNTMVENYLRNISEIQEVMRR